MTALTDSILVIGSAGSGLRGTSAMPGVSA